jgi:hypothetical protein
MKEILTTAISNTVGLPLLGRTIDFIRDNVKEQTTSLAYSELNSSNDSLPIVLYGCIGTYSTVGFTNDTYTITKGAILYQGEIYQVPAMVATRANIGETIVFRIDSTTFQEGEPTLYTDGASRNTNLDRTIKIYNGATGSGIIDAVNLKYLNYSKVDDTSVGNVVSSSISAVTGSATSITYALRAEKRGDIITLFTFCQFTAGASDVDLRIALLPKFMSKYSAAFTCSIRRNDGSQQLFAHQSFGNANTNNFIICAGLTTGQVYMANSIVSYLANEIG